MLTNGSIIESALLRNVDDFGNVLIFDEDRKMTYPIQRLGIIRVIPLAAQLSLKELEGSEMENGREGKTV